MNTTYRYHVFTNRGGLRSIASGEATATTNELRLRLGDHHHGHHGEPHALRRHGLHALGIHSRRQRCDADDPARHQGLTGDFNTSARRCSSCAAPRSTRSARRRADRLHLVARRGTAPARRLGRTAPRRQRDEQPQRASSTSRARARTETPSSAARTTRCSTPAERRRRTTRGTLSYVRVEFAGFAPLQEQELNAFTFCAVGSGTRARISRRWPVSTTRMSSSAAAWTSIT